ERRRRHLFRTHPRPALPAAGPAPVRLLDGRPAADGSDRPRPHPPRARGDRLLRRRGARRRVLRARPRGVGARHRPRDRPPRTDARDRRGGGDRRGRADRARRDPGVDAALRPPRPRHARRCRGAAARRLHARAVAGPRAGARPPARRLRDRVRDARVHLRPRPAADRRGGRRAVPARRARAVR
ncbi:MAG: hypothetical protein AVDCRST_MAG30-4083, partial [uncultured Solirubrobacteraceae bacterium]